jgi:hypothetical protein
MYKIFAILLFLVTVGAKADVVELICKNFSFGMTVGGVVLGRNTSITYEKISIQDASGAHRTIFAPTRIVAIQQFLGTSTAAGSHGELLAPGQCSLVDRAIAGISTDARSGRPTIQFNGFASNFVQVGNSTMGPAGVQVAVNLPACASGIRKFRAIQESANSYFLNDGPEKVTCIL